MSEIEKWSDVDLTKYLNLILTVSKNMLTPHFEGTSWSDINTVIFHQGALPGNEIVNNIRSKSINILKRIFNLIKQLPDKQKIMELFDKATVPPHQNGYTPELENIIRENVSTLIAYYLLII
ncbi:hypothetical protein, partial [Legionella parisiensis]|uniref:hypothetical protein n=1 Tax=Legionella parisiensis TaxID=45071 RepID=UPI000A858CF5